MKAEDNKDGDVTDSIVVVSKSKFIDTGKMRVNYAAFDKKSNVGTFTREVQYTDYTSPKFSLRAPLRFMVNKENNSLLNIISAEDCLDGNISGLIKLKYDDGEYVMNKDESEVGEFGLTFQVTNSAGDTVSLPVKLEFLNEEQYNQPFPALKEYVVYTELNKKPDFSEYLTGISISGREQSFVSDYEDGGYSVDDVKIKPDVDYKTPGVYTVAYTLEKRDDYGEMQQLGTTTLYVVVGEQGGTHAGKQK